MNISLDQAKISELKTQLSLLVNHLLNALEGNDQAQAFSAQQAPTDAIDSLWHTVENVDIDPNIKAISRLVAGGLFCPTFGLHYSPHLQQTIFLDFDLENRYYRHSSFMIRWL